VTNKVIYLHFYTQTIGVVFKIQHLTASIACKTFSWLQNEKWHNAKQQD